MDIGLIAASGKPIHAGHMGLFQIAAKETDRVIIFVSLKDRARAGEMTVRGEDMAVIWEEYLIPIMPKNIAVEFVDIPVASIYEVLQSADQDLGDTNVYHIYSDPEDLAARFSDRSLKKYCPRLVEESQVVLRAVKRTETVDVSGTKMRAAVASGDFETFRSGMPKGINLRAIWDILRGHSDTVSPVKRTRKPRKTESLLLRKFVHEVVKRV